MILDDLVELRETINDRKNYKEHALDFSNYLASDYKKLGWVVPNEDYERTIEDNSIVKNNLDKSGFSK